MEVTKEEAIKVAKKVIVDTVLKHPDNEETREELEASLEEDNEENSLLYDMLFTFNKLGLTIKD